MGLIKELFYKGEYLAVLKRTYEDQSQVELGVFSYVIGSLGFLGRIQEAEALYQAHRTKLNETQRAYSYFFLALTWTRRSQYARAKKYLILNRGLSKKNQHRDPEIRFLMEQGISFFLFFIGKFEKSLLWSEKSLSSAMASNDFWMRALSQDLLANNLIQNGRIHEGIRHFNEALNCSKKLKNLALIDAIEISTVVLSCEYGINLNESYQKLRSYYNNQKQLDSFSVANLGLEYARQLTLRGQWKSATEKLNEVSASIFQNQNRRQEARFNLRFAEIYYLKNEPNTCLHYVRSGRRCLEFIDYTYEMQFIGMETKVYQNLLIQKVPESLIQRLKELSMKFNNIKNNNILARNSHFENSTLKHSDDEIHQLLQKAEQNLKSARKIILQTGYLSWLYRFFDIRKGERYILMNVEPKSITYITGDGVFHRPNELSTLNFKIISKLAEGYTSKEDLVNSVWGYEYDTLRHDSLIYSAFSGLRKILSEDSRIIETSEVGYTLNAQVINLLETSKGTNKPHKIDAVSVVTDLSGFLEHGLNSRQIQIMQYLDQNQFISVKIAIKLFSTSEITANRDLRTLFQKNLVLRIGQGRSTHYAKAGQL